MVCKYCIQISYHGSDFSGWNGNNDKFLYFVIRETIYIITRKYVNDLCIAGRTDAEVSALNNYVSFSIDINLDNYFIQKANMILRNRKVVFKSIKLVDNDFSARFSAKSRTYHYLFYFQPSIFINIGCYLYKIINIDLMKEASNYLIGLHDFSSFCPKKYENKRIRSINYINFIEYKEFDVNFLCIEINAKSFMHHQVRYIIGALLKVGQNKWSLQNFLDYKNAKQVSIHTSLASAKGLLLYQVEY